MFFVTIAKTFSDAVLTGKKFVLLHLDEFLLYKIINRTRHRSDIAVALKKYYRGIRRAVRFQSRHHPHEWRMGFDRSLQYQIQQIRHLTRADHALHTILKPRRWLTLALVPLLRGVTRRASHLLWVKTIRLASPMSVWYITALLGVGVFL